MHRPCRHGHQARHNAPDVTIDNLEIVPEPGNPKPTSFHIVLSGRDFAMVTEGMRVELYPGSGPLQSTLRCYFLASVQPRPRYRITKVSETVTSGGALNAMRSNAVITTQTRLGGVALPAAVQNIVEAQHTQHIPSISIPALSQCAGQPLALDVLLRVKASRVDGGAEVIADFDSYDLRFELARCP